jgi:hypothetical protein
MPSITCSITVARIFHPPICPYLSPPLTGAGSRVVSAVENNNPQLIL